MELLKRNGREQEACALERLAENWLELIPLLVQACLKLPHPPDFLHELFQVCRVRLLGELSCVTCLNMLQLVVQ